jgi:hypothetical protein
MWMEDAPETGQNPRKNHKAANKIPENAKFDLASFDALDFFKSDLPQPGFSIANGENPVASGMRQALSAVRVVLGAFRTLQGVVVTKDTGSR